MNNYCKIYFMNVITFHLINELIDDKYNYIYIFLCIGVIELDRLLAMFINNKLD